MIVMKFGGSSLASAASLGRVVSIIRSEVRRHPVVVASALGDTTDSLLEILSAARRANSYSAWKRQEVIKNQHFALCEELLHGPQQSVNRPFLRPSGPASSRGLVYQRSPKAKIKSGNSIARYRG